MYCRLFLVTMEIVMIITTLMTKNVYEQDDHYQSGAKSGPVLA